MDRAEAVPRMDLQRYGAAKSFFSLLQLQFPADAQILRFWQAHHLRVEIDLSRSNCGESTEKTKYVACLTYSP